MTISPKKIMMKHKNTLIIAKRILSEAFEQSIDLRLKDIVVDYRGAASTILRGEVIAASGSCSRLVTDTPAPES